MSTGWRAAAHARLGRAAAASRSISSKLSITISPTPTLQRHAAARPRTWRCRAGRSARARSPPSSARCSSPPEATSHHSPSCANSASTAVQGKAFEANTTWKSSWPVPRAGLHERAGARAQVVLGDDVGRRAELARELDRVAAADLEAAALVQAAAEREDVGEARAGGHRRDYRLPAERRRRAVSAQAVLGRSAATMPPRRAISDEPHRRRSRSARRSRAAARSAPRRPRCCGG